MMTYNTAIVLMGTALLSALAGLVGCFAVLRRHALMGDALAHAALPGLCLAYLVVGERNLPAMLVGALLSGWLGVLCIQGIIAGTRIKQDAAVGIILSVFFGAGIVLSQIIQQSPSGGKAGLDSFIYGKTAGMIAQDVYWIAAIVLLALIVIIVAYKEFKLIAFDPDFAKIQGWPATRLDLILKALLGLTVVVGLPSVGVVMIAALLVLPCVIMRFWTDTFMMLLIGASLFGVAMGISGTWISSTIAQMPTGPTIILFGTAFFLLSAVLSPKRGILSRMRRWHNQELDQSMITPSTEP